MKTPVSLVTGYLGSGKTTLIASVLRDPGLADTAVIVNELGAVAIDHAILRRVDERTVVLGSGCLCCTLRGDLAEELRDLVDRRDAAEIPDFRRVVVETTGLADPTPIVNTLLADPLVRHQYELDGVVATVDAQHGLRGPESVKQVAAADVVVVTKVDVVDGAAVGERVGRINPAAELLEAVHGRVDPALLFGRPRAVPAPALMERDHRHDEDVQALSLVLDEPLDWTAFGIWLTMLLHARGADILRVKGLLNVGGDAPLLLDGVQHAVHPPRHLDAWPDDDRRSRLVFIGRGIEQEQLERSLRAFDGAARARWQAVR